MWYSLLHKLYVFVAVHGLLESGVWYARLAHDILMIEHRRHASGAHCHVAGATAARHYSARRAFWNS